MSLCAYAGKIGATRLFLSFFQDGIAMIEGEQDRGERRKQARVM